MAKIWMFAENAWIVEEGIFSLFEPAALVLKVQ